MVFQLCLLQCQLRHYKLISFIFIVPPVALTEPQVLTLYFFYSYRHFPYDDVIIIMLYVFSTNITISLPLESFSLHALIPRISFHGKKLRQQSVCLQ